jgi:hypothetical protein
LKSVASHVHAGGADWMAPVLLFPFGTGLASMSALVADVCSSSSSSTSSNVEGGCPAKEEADDEDPEEVGEDGTDREGEVGSTTTRLSSSSIAEVMTAIPRPAVTKP